MEDYYEYLDSNGVTTLYKLIKDDTVALIDSYSVTINGITTTLDTHINDTDIHTPISDIESMVDTKVSGLVNSAPETLDTLKELSDALGNDPNFATTVANQIGNKANKDSVYTKEETNTLLEGKANSKHNHVVSDITDFPTIPTKVSELSNDSNFVTSTELHDYATKNDLNSKQDALSEEQLSNIDSIPDKANKSDLSTVATSGSYKDLLDKPVIPEGADLSDYYNKGETDNLLNSKANTSDLAVVAKSGNYNDLSNTPTIPTKVSDLTNDSGYITGVAWGDITSKPSFSYIAISGSYNDLVDTPTIPTKTSELTNDSGYITSVSWEDVTSKPELSQVAISGSYSDLSDTPTIPTKTSQLINDSGFLTSSSGVITSVSWSDITDKPNFSTVATSGSYTDLSNTPTIPTKVSQLENDMGFGTGGDTSDCVHKTGNETINGTKTFISGPWVTNNHNTTGYSIKDTALARNDIPTEYQHYTFRAYDKNNNILGEYCIEKATTGDALLSMNVRSEDSSGTQISYGMQFRMTNDGSLVRFMPSANNKVHLGDPSAKWLKVHSDDVVHTSGNETINGNKTFNNNVIICGDVYDKNVQADLTQIPTSNLYTQYRFVDKNNKTMGYIQHVQRNTGVNQLTFIARDSNNVDHGFFITTNKELLPAGNNTYSLGSAGLKWKKIYSDDVVHTSGIETIAGVKKFTSDLARKFTEVDITTTPTSDMYAHFNFTDKNDKTVAYIQYAQKTNGVDYIGLRVRDKNSTTWGVQINTNKEFVPLGNNSYSLGSANYKWGKIYSDDIVHTSGTETISGYKKFTNNVYMKNNSIDLTSTPSEDKLSLYGFIDKNEKTLSSVQYVQRTTGVNDLSLFVLDNDSGLHGIQLNTKNELRPRENNVYSLGSSNLKWKNVYATTFNGNLRGNADTATKATSADSVAWANVTGKPNIPTTPNAYVTATWASGLNWYRKWSNGFIEQGGFTSGANAPANKVVASILPLAFSNTKYTLLVQVTCGPSSGTSWGSTLPTTRSKSTTRFEVYLDTPVINGGGYDWYACGY